MSRHHRAIVDSDSSGEEDDSAPVTGPPTRKSLHRIVDDLGDDDDEDYDGVVLPVIPLPPASEEEREQKKKAISQVIKDGKNGIVDAVAGSGKTTSLGHSSVENSDKIRLGLLYNREATDKSRIRLNGLCLIWYFELFTVQPGLITKFHVQMTTV